MSFSSAVPTENNGLFPGAEGHPVEAPAVTSAGEGFLLPNARFAVDAEYRQQGDDLVLTGGDGMTVVVPGYFLADPRPDLLTPEGGRITPSLVASFTPPEAAGQYAQAGSFAQAAEPIGQVDNATGGIFVVRRRNIWDRCGRYLTERWHQTLKNRILLDNYFFPADLEAQIKSFVDHYNHQRYHESINNLTPADVYFGRGQVILKQRERIKRKTMEQRRLQYRKHAA